MRVILIVALLTILWFIPERPMQVLKAVREFTRALGPGEFQVPTSTPAYEDASGRVSPP